MEYSYYSIETYEFQSSSNSAFSSMDILNTKYFSSCSFQENSTLHSSGSDDTSSVKQLVGSISGNKDFENQGFQTGGEEINANAGQLQLA